jgi:CRISPR-associated exonuclease Cas4
MTSFTPDQITGTLVNYYTTCHREAWLYAHHIHADQDDDNILMGKALAEIKEKNLQNFPFSNLKFDKLSKERGHYMVTEYKKSMKNTEAAKMQLLFYMYQLKMGLKLKTIKGRVISGKKVIAVEGSDENFRTLEVLMEALVEDVSTQQPPKAEKIPFCQQCAYKNYCF